MDDRFSPEPPTQQLPWLTWVGVWLRHETPADRYVPEQDEATFQEFEKRLVEIAGALAEGWAVYCMRILSRGIVEFYFYTREKATIESLADQFRAEYPEYRVEQETFPDAEWLEYKKYLAAVC